MRAVHLLVRLGALTAALLAQTVTAQQPLLKGDHVLAEEGFSRDGPIASLARITFSESGHVSGHQIIRTPAGITAGDFTGTYRIEAEGIGSLHLEFAFEDDEGNSRTLTSNFKFLFSSTDIRAIRTDAGVYTVGRLLPAATTSVLSGKYIFAESAQGVPVSRLVSFSVDSSGGVLGASVAESLGVTSISRLSGNLGSNDKGFATLTLAAETEDEEGNLVRAQEGFVVLAAKDQAIMMRTEGGLVNLNFLSR